MVHLRSINYGSPDSVCVCLLNPLLCLLLHSCRASVPGALSVYIYNSQRRPVLISLFMVLYNKNRPCIKCTQTNHGLSNLYKYLYKFDIFLLECKNRTKYWLHVRVLHREVAQTSHCAHSCQSGFVWVRWLSTRHWVRAPLADWPACF